MDASLKIKFLKSLDVPMQNWETHCSCCGPELHGYEPSFFLEGDEVDPDELYHKLNLMGLKFGEDYVITEFLPDEPSKY